ncbi:hypothetical protein [Singulisphaera sp. PoT]|uniref:hypothetical protein n=1 Tax=Singulisphaera sp. PoT TaxID=3411797 RepID=UPI003BF5393E
MLTTVIPFQPDPVLSLPTDLLKLNQTGQYSLTGTLTASTASTSIPAEEWQLGINIPKTPITVSVSLDSSTGQSISVLLDIGAGPGVNVPGRTITPFHGFMSGDTNPYTTAPVEFASTPDFNTDLSHVSFNIFVENTASDSTIPVTSNYAVNIDIESTGTTQPTLPDIAVSNASLNGSNVDYDYQTTDNPGNFTVDLYQSATPTFDASTATLVGTQTVTNPQTNGKGAFSLANVPPNVAQPYLLLVARPINVIQESDETNNVTSVSYDPANLPDIGMTSATFVGSKVNFDYQTIGKPGKVTVGLYRSATPVFNPLDKSISTQTIDATSVASGSGFFNLTASPSRAYPYLLVVADPANAILESNEKNNVASTHYEPPPPPPPPPVTPPPPPVSLPDIQMLSAVLNGTTVEYRYQTTGNPAKFDVAFFLSPTPQPDPATLKYLTTQKEVSGASPVNEESFNLTSYPSDLSRPYLVVVADPANSIKELNEWNNATSILLASSIVPTLLSRAPSSMAADPGVNISYLVFGSILQDASIFFYWANGPDATDRLDAGPAYVYAINSQGEKIAGSHGPIYIPATDFVGARRHYSDATFLLLELTYNNTTSTISMPLIVPITVDQIDKIVPFKYQYAESIVRHKFAPNVNYLQNSYKQNSQSLAEYLNSNEAVNTYHLTTFVRRSAFIGQVAVETAGLMSLTQFQQYKKPATPFSYGRGFLDITGRRNYLYASTALGLGNLLILDPGLLASNPALGARASGWYWGKATGSNLNRFADNWNILTIGRGVQIGDLGSTQIPNGEPERVRYSDTAYSVLKDFWGYDPRFGPDRNARTR